MSKGRKDRVFLGRWNVLVTILLAIGLFFAGRYYESKQSKQQIEQLEQQSKQAKTALEYSTEPSCALTFQSGNPLDGTPPSFLLKNQGPGRLDDVWLREMVFLVDSGGVHECPDLPHFEYFYYCGQIASMGSLYVHDQRAIELPACWKRAFDLIALRFPGGLVSRFRLTGTSLASPEFRRDFYFIIDRGRGEYVAPDEYIGGRQLVQRVTTYTHHGPRSIIRWVRLPDFSEFYKTTPKFFYQPDGKQYVPWYGPGLPPVSPATAPVYFSRYNILPVKGGSARLTWDCEEDGPIAVMYGCQPGAW